MTKKVFIDGASGSAGLALADRLGARDDLRLLALPHEARRDMRARSDLMREADLVALCLPTEAAREAAAAVPEGVRVADASSAHRLDPAWEYGFLEWAPGQRARIAAARRVAVPGCYAVGMVAAVRPLTLVGALDPDAPLAVHGASGYSGGGRALIADFQSAASPDPYRLYAMRLTHKHAPEMRAWAGMRAPVVFTPAVVNAYRGMVVSVPLRRAWLDGRSVADVRALLEAHYADAPLVRIAAAADDATLNLAHAAADEGLTIHVGGDDAAGFVLLASALDNLNFGAAGMMERCIEAMLGLDARVAPVAPARARELASAQA